MVCGRYYDFQHKRKATRSCSHIQRISTWSSTPSWGRKSKVLLPFSRCPESSRQSKSQDTSSSRYFHRAIFRVQLCSKIRSFQVCRMPWQLGPGNWGLSSSVRRTSFPLSHCCFMIGDCLFDDGVSNPAVYPCWPMRRMVTLKRPAAHVQRPSWIIYSHDFAQFNFPLWETISACSRCILWFNHNHPVGRSSGRWWCGDGVGGSKVWLSSCAELC